MVKKHTLSAAIIMSLSSALALAPASAFAEHRCDHPQGLGEARACAKAAESPEALRRFVLRTRMIWGLSYADYARDAKDVPRAADKQPETAVGMASTERR